MFLKYKPTWMVSSIYQITPEQLKKLGIKAVLTDLDNTLIAWNNPDGTPELRAWLEKMKEANIPVVVVSNNKASRVARAVKPFGLDFISRAMKPFGLGIRRAMKQLNLQPEQVIMVGDQLMTDIRASHAANIRSVLVKPIVKTDAWNTRINRMREKVVMNHLLKKHQDMIWKGAIENE